MEMLSSPLAINILKILLIFLISFSLFFISRTLYRLIIKGVKNRLTKLWSKILLSNSFLFHLAWILPIYVFRNLLVYVDGLNTEVTTIADRATAFFITFFCLRALNAILGAINLEYSKLEISKSKPVKGYIQVLQIILWFVGVIVLISIVVDKSPLIFLSGLGAMTALLLLIFRDTILSFVAGAQLSLNNLIQVGDWIEMPQFGADGDVVDIALHYVKIQNFDKTITIIPTHKFLENSFKNWRGMKETGGRRIKRSIFIDMHSVKFLSNEEIEYLQKFNLLKSYLQDKKGEISKHNEKISSEDLKLNERRLTNLGTFRAYLVSYLRNNPNIHQDLPIMIRQLQPTETGIPLEIYVFTSDIKWINYEGIQADIFDHILAIIPEFKLNVFQTLSGKDFKAMR